jgi:hypothetical protein
MPAKNDAKDEHIQPDRVPKYGILGGVTVTGKAHANNNPKVTTKICRGSCGKEKPLTDFYEHQAICKTCLGFDAK